MFKTKKKCQNINLEQNRKIFNKKNNIFNYYNDAKNYITTNYKTPKILSNQQLQKGPSADRSCSAKYYGNDLNDKFSHKFYNNITLNSIINTLNYIFHRHKNGIYISIRDNKMDIFMVFDNMLYKNPLVNYYDTNPKIKNDFIKYIKTHPESNLDFDKIKFNDKKLWYNINCLFFNLYKDGNTTTTSAKKGYEYRSYISEIKYFFTILCKNIKIADSDFFFNLHDQMILEKNFNIPFLSITNNKKIKIDDFYKTKFSPICSFSTNKDYIDIPFILPDDIQFITKSYWRPKCADPVDNRKFNLNWTTKKNCLVFRGGATGCGFTVYDNPRIELLYKSKMWIKKTPDLYDIALLGKEEIRFKKHANDKYIRYYEEKKIELEPDNFLSITEQSNYKYIIYIEGNVAAYRISTLLSIKSVIIYLESDYDYWYSNLFIHKVNCIKIKKINEIPNIINWCIKNDKECEIIANNAYELSKNLVNKRNFFKYVKYLSYQINQLYSAEDIK
jgi:hypothetical protein